MEQNTSTPPSATESVTGPRPRESRLRLVTVEQTGAVAEGHTLVGPQAARDALRAYFEPKDREHFVVLHLDGAHRVVSAEVVSIGTLTSALVHAREVFKAAILANARAIICSHNHPSGERTPSREDRMTFEKLAEAGKLLGIPLLDFLIFGGNGCWSAVEDGTWTAA